MTNRCDHVVNDDFMAVVKADCFQRPLGDTAEWLRSDENIERFHEALVTLAADLHCQLSQYKLMVESGAWDKNPEWRRSAGSLKSAVDRRLAEVRPAFKAFNRRMNPAERSVETRSILRQLRFLRHAIHQHRDTHLIEDYEPTDADLDLWSALDGERELGSGSAVERAFEAVS